MDSQKFIRNILHILNDSKIPFLIGGTFAIREYTDIQRDTADLDIFCQAGNFLEIVDLFSKAGFKTEISDERWLAKIFNNHFVVDIIFNSPQGICPVDKSWFKNAPLVTIEEIKVRLVSPEEMIWSKAYRQDRHRYEGPDINHLILKQGEKLDWKHLLNRMESHWEILLAHLINFRFVYPSERNIVPRWLVEELLNRVKLQLVTPAPKMKVCRGPFLAIDPYKIDIFEWGFKDIL